MDIHRQEIKYIISKSQSETIIKRMDNFFNRDIYSKDKPYLITSLYFDSVNNIDFYEKLAGVPNRKKIRLRYYNNDNSYYRLEMKEKHNIFQNKKGIEIKERDALDISNGNYGCLKNYFDDNNYSSELYSIMTQGMYKPVANIAYNRLAYTFYLYDTRITFDSDIRKKEGIVRLHHEDFEYERIDPNIVILEVKFSGKCPGIVSDMLSAFNLDQNSYSKYLSGRIQYYNFNY